LFYLFQVALLRRSYQSKLDANLAEIAKTIATAHDPASPALTEVLRKLCPDTNCCVAVYQVTDTMATAVQSIDVMGNQCLLHSHQDPPPVPIETMVQQLVNAKQYEPTTKEIYFNYRNMLLLSQLISTPDGFLLVLVNTSLERLDTTVSLLQDQFLIICVGVFFLALSIGFVIATLIARPLRRTSARARELARGNYNIQFAPGNFREINDLADSLNYAARGLSEVDRLRQELIANVSHDLRTPLTMIRAYAEMLQDFSWEDAEQRENHLGIIITESDRLTKLVRDLLNLSQLTSEETALDDVAFDLGALCMRTCLHFEALAAQKNIELNLQAPDTQRAFGDAPRIEQVLYNLLNNAIAYTPEGGEVTVILTRRINNWVRLSISDTGRGIPADQLTHIWDRYYRTGDQKEVSGTGLGLSIVRAILTRHDARFGATSRVGTGSTFWFELRNFPKGKKKK